MRRPATLLQRAAGRGLALAWATWAAAAAAGAPGGLRSAGRAARGSEAAEAAASRGLAALQTCGEAQNGSWAPWVISCGGPFAVCTDPYCPLGYTTDHERPKCILADWEAPYCVPSTFWVRIYRGHHRDPSVDDPFPLLVQAFMGSWQLSLTEYRPLVLVKTSSSSSARQWQITMTAGEGALNISHTVAEEVHLQLAGSDYSSFVHMESLNVTFLPGVAVRYVFADSVLQGSVDWPVRVRVEARDQYDNIATGEQRGLWIAFNTSTVQVVDFANGVGTALVSSRLPGAVQVGLLDGWAAWAAAGGRQREAGLQDPAFVGVDLSSTMTVHFSVGAVYRYAFAALASDSFIAGDSAPIALVAEDQYGNLVEAEDRGVTVLTSSGSGGGGQVAFVNGRASTSVTHTVAEMVVLSLRDDRGTGLDVASTLTVRFVGGAAFLVTLSASPVQGTVDAPLEVTLTALDRYNNLAASATEAVQVVATGTLVSGGGPVSFVQGRVTASISSQRAQVVQVSLQDLGASLDVSATLDLDFLPGAPRAFALEAPASGIAGTPAAVVVKALDQYGNTATGASTSVTVQASGSAEVAQDGVVILFAGHARALLRSTRAERVELTLEDTFITGLDVSARAEVVFHAAPATRYVLGYATAQTIASVDGTVDVTVTAMDQYGNVASDEQRGVGLRTNSSAASTNQVVVTNGVGSFSVGHTLPESLTLSLVDTASTALDVSSTLPVTFTAGQARSIVFQPGSATSGSVDAALPVPVVALDQYGNVATGSSSIDVEARLTGTQVGGAGLLALVQGRGAAAVTSQRSQTVQLSFVDTYGTGLDVSATIDLTFTAGAPTRVAMTAAATGTVGIPVSVVLTSFDQYGNVAVSGTASLSVRASGSAVVPSSGLVQLQSGTAGLLVEDTRAETVTLSMEDSFSSGLDLSDTHSLVFHPGPATRYAFAASRLQASVDSGVQVDVHALDEFGNLATDQNADAGFTSSAGGGTTSVDVSGGQGSAQVSHAVAEVVTLVLVDAHGTGLDVSTAGLMEVEFTPGAAQRVELQASATSSTVDAPLQVVVRALDRFGNLATGESRAVELRKGGLASVGRVDFSGGQGIASVSSTDVGTFTVSVQDTYGTGLDCSATLSLTFTPGAPAYVLLSPQSGNVGQAVNLTLTSLDQYGNQAPAGAGRVTVRASGSAVVFDDGIAQLQGGTAVVFVRNTRAETVTLSMEDSFSSGWDVSDTKTMVFFANPATRYAFVSVPMEVSVDDAAEISVHALDEYGNVATTQQADVGVQVSGLVSASIVDIASGRGTLQVSRMAPQLVSLALVDSQGTGLSVAGEAVNFTFIPGAARSLVFQPSSTTGTVDDPIGLELLAHDRYGNLATGEGRAVEVRTSADRVSGLGRVDLSQGRGSTSVASELAQTVEVTLYDVFGTGLDCTASASLLFGHGELRSFRLTDSTGASRAVAKVGRTVTSLARAEDQFGNLVADLQAVELSGELRPAPTNGTNASLVWSLGGGLGSKDIQIFSPGIFSVLVSNAQLAGPGNASAQASLLAAAADRSEAWRLEYRLDLVPPDYDSLNISSLSPTELTLNVNGLSEPSTVWCLAADPAGGAPSTPPSLSDGAVYTALRGPGNATSTPSARGGPFTVSGQLMLTELEAGRTYAIRCAAADEEGNQMTGQTILEHQLLVTAPRPPATVPTQAPEEESNTMFIVGIVVAVLGALLCCGAAAFLLRARSTAKKAKQSVKPAWEGGTKSPESVVPQPNSSPGEAEPGRVGGDGRSLPGVDQGASASLAEEINKSGDTSPSVYYIEEPSPKTTNFQAVEEDDEDTDDEPPGAHDAELLRDALAMQQELMDELQKRGALEANAEEDYDSTESDDSDAEAVVRDVKAFLRQQLAEQHADDEGAAARAPAPSLPELPLLLGAEDEARLSALVALGQQDGPAWAQRLANFDELWRTAHGQAWQEARPVVRSEMQERQNQIEAVRERLKEAASAIEAQAEACDSAVLDALAAEEEAFAQEADERLKALHQLAIDWPEEDARQRNAVITEWAPRITAADSLPKAERAQIRKEAIEALRKLDDEREAALEAELEKFEASSTSRFEAMQEGQAEAWRQMCEGSDHKAADLREQLARLRLQLATLARQAEEAALQAALRLRRRLRDGAIEAEMAKEAEERESQIAQWRARIQDLPAGDAEGTAALRERALAALDRASGHARKVAAEEQARRKRHWHEILEERSRDRLKALRRRYQDEERRLADEAARAQEEAAEAEAQRRTVLVLGALHRSEAATLAVASAARRGRILMGLQATAAGSVAEERLPRREAGDRLKSEKSEALGITRAVSTGMGVTSLRWQDAKRKAAEELNAALDQVAEILSEHGQRQRALLAHRQRREASLARAPEGDDERREDLLDALEENMRRELRAARWHHQCEAAEALAHRGAGEESELGRRLAAVARDSNLLGTEDEIGERYDRLRALVLGPGAEEEYAAQRQAQALEREAAALRADADRDADAAVVDFPQPAWDSPKAGLESALPSLSESRVEAFDEAVDDKQFQLERERKVRQRKRHEALQRARELVAGSRLAEAVDLLLEALAEEDAAGADVSKPGNAFDLTVQSVTGSDWKKDAPRTVGQQAGADEARPREAVAKGRELRAQGNLEEAVDVLINALQGAEDAEQARTGGTALAGRSGTLSDEDRDKVFHTLSDSQDRRSKLLAQEGEAQRAKLEARRRRRQDALQRARELEAGGQSREAAEAVVAVLAAEAAEERGAEAAEASALDWKGLQEELFEHGKKIDGAIAEDAEARRARLAAQRASRRRHREELLDKAKKLQSNGFSGQAFEVAVQALEEESKDEAEEEEAVVAVSRQAAEGASMPEGERAKFMSALGESQEALEREREAQRRRLEARRRGRQQQREDAQRQAEDLAAHGDVSQALDVAAEALAAQEAGGGSTDVDWSGLKDDLSKRQDRVDGAMASEAEAHKLRIQQMRAERKRRREEAQATAKELQEQGLEQEALEVIVQALKEDGEASDKEEEECEALQPPRPQPRRLSDAERQRILGAFAEGEAQRDEAVARDAEVQRQKVEARRLARQQKREEAEARAEELEKQAAELRAAAAAKASKAAGAGAGPATAAAEDFDAVAEWQEAARRRAVVGHMASFCQRSQESAARRLPDASESADAAKERGALKDAFASEMQKAGAAVADEREVQKKRARERLEERRRRRQEASAKAQEPDRRPTFGTAAQKMRKAVQNQFHGIHGLQKIHGRRRQKVLEEHREVERRVRAEVEAEMEALRQQLHQEANAHIRRLSGQVDPEAAPIKQEEPPNPLSEEEAKRAREAGMARTDEVKGLIQSERQRQAERIEARLAKRRGRLVKREAAVVQYHQLEEARVELDNERERLQAKPVSKAKNKRLMKELHKVNGIIAGLTGSPSSGDTPASPLARSPLGSPLAANGGARTGALAAGTRVLDVDESEISEEEV